MIFTTLYIHVCNIYIDAVHCEVSVSELYNVCCRCMLTLLYCIARIIFGGLAKKPFFCLADFNLAVCSSTHIPNTCTHTHAQKNGGFKFGGAPVNRQSAKLNYMPNFPAIQ